jgi:DNA-directed RNA polymerase subunit beta'
MTKITTPGALLIKQMMPTPQARENFNLHKPLNKGGMKDLVNMLIEHGGDTGHETINELSKLFFNKATEIGATTPLSDYENDSEERQAMFSEFETKVAEILAKRLPKMDQARELDKLSQSIAGRMSKHNLEYMVSRGSTAARMAMTGARGNPAQLQQGTASPMMAADVRGLPIPVAIKHSFAEGLSNAEHLAMSYGGRASTVMSQLSTEKPGALFKKLTPAVFHEVVTEQDCGTKQGIPIPLTDKLSCIGRYEAGTNHLIDEHYWKELHIGSKKSVIARNPMTCRAKEGLCQKCYGLNATGQLPPIGQNVGVIAAQSVSEVLTQAMLGTKHQGGVAGRQRNPYEEANNILSNPQNFQDEATIAKVNGTVQKIEQTSLKDWDITVDGVPHFVQNVQEPTVKVGDKVRIGDALSTGTLNPRTLVSLKGAGAGRVYLANKMREVYSRNTLLDPRHFDIIARNMIKYKEVVDPGESGFMPGDKVEVSQIEHHLERNAKKVSLSAAEGKTLATRTLDLTPGTILTKNHLDDLKQHGVTDVYISDSGLVVKPLVPGLQVVKFMDKNWVSKLSFNKLQDTIREAAALGQQSDIHSTDPITSYTLGTEFGEGDKGKY